MKRLVISIAALLSVSGVVPAYAFDVPANDGYVTDTQRLLSPEQETDLENKLQLYREQTSNEIAILIIPSLLGEEIADAAVEVLRAWGIGDKQKNNGLLILMAYDDRKIFMVTGYGLEGALPDIVVKGIVDTDITPQFKEGKYYEGLLAGLEALRKHIANEYTPDRYQNMDSEEGSGVTPALIFFVFILLQWAFAIMSRTKSWWLGGVFGGIFGVVMTFLFTFWLSIPLFVMLGLVLDYLISKNYRQRGTTKWWAGGGWGPGGGGSGGGGFGGFSGGSSGGGGAGGSW